MGTGYGIDYREAGVRVLVGARFSPLRIFQTDSGASYSVGTVGVKQPGREADHL
jgi:hypothetical protein